MIEVLHVDDHTIFRSGVRRLLLDEDDIRVTAEARSAAEALDCLDHGRYGAMLLDINMEGRSGLDVLASMRSREGCPPVLVLSMYPEEQYALVAVQAGASGYITKDAEPAELIRAIRLVASGGHYLSPTAAPLVQARLRGEPDDRPPHQKLTVREHQIMLMLIKGMSATEIGQEMLISIKTVSTHRTHLLEKLGVASTAELVLYAVRQGMIH